MKFSEHLDNIEQSETFRFFALMKEKIAQGKEVVPLVTGELSEHTPHNIAQAGIDAIHSGKTKYTLNDGIIELRQAICDRVKIETNQDYKPDQVLISNGGKHALFNCLYSLCGHNDEVIIIAPYYSSYPDMIKLTGATPVIINTISNDGIPTKELLESAVTEKTKAIIINSPCNPTGVVYSKDTLFDIIDVVNKHKLWLISDEIYEKILYDGAIHYSPLSLDKEIYERTILLNSFSKTYAMTGWRIGYAVGPKELIQKAALVQSQSTSNASSISQYAALEALNSDDSFIKAVVHDLQKKRDTAIELLSELDDITYITPTGAFYLFINISPFFQSSSIKNSNDLALYLLDKYDVGTVPGSAFGADDYIRISYAGSFETVSKGVRNIVAGLKELRAVSL